MLFAHITHGGGAFVLGHTRGAGQGKAGLVPHGAHVVSCNAVHMLATYSVVALHVVHGAHTRSDVPEHGDAKYVPLLQGVVVHATQCVSE